MGRLMTCAGPCAARNPAHGFLGGDLEETKKENESAGSECFQGRPREKVPSTFYEMKFRDPEVVSQTVPILIGAQRGI